VQAFPPYGDTLLVLVCERFVQKFGTLIVEKKLRYQLLLHLMSLWDFGLLTAEEVWYFMQEVDSIQHAITKLLS